MIINKSALTLFVFCWTMLVAPVFSAEEAKPQQANAEQLIMSAQRAVGQLVLSAKSDAALRQDSAEAKPFWNAMKDLNESLTKARTGLILKDSTFFTALATSGASVAQADISLIMSGSSDQAVASNMQTLSGVVEALYMNFSKEAARLKQGGELSPKEQAQLDKLIAQQDALMAKLDEVEKNVAKSDEKMKAGIEKIRKESKKIRRSSSSVGGFVGGFFAAHFMWDIIWGWHWWWGPWGAWAPGFLEINIVVWDDWIDYYDYDWAVVDDFVDVDDLGLDLLDIDDAALAATNDFLEQGDFGLEADDLSEMTSDLDQGWGDVDTDTGMDIREGVESNFDRSGFYERDEPVNTFEDYGMDDFGGGFDGGMDFDF